MKSIEAEDEMQERNLEGTVQYFYLLGAAAWFSQYTYLTVAYTRES
jgi:hypothetical protein